MPRVATRSPSHLVSRVRSPSLLPEAQRPAIQWSTRARRGARRGGGAAPSDFRRGPSLAAPREPNTPPLPGSPSSDKENKDGGMSWAGQLWKQYDPINKIIFPGVGSKPTYNERGTELRNEARARDVDAPDRRASNASPLPAPRRPIQQIRRSTFSAVFRRLKTHLRTISRASPDTFQ